MAFSFRFEYPENAGVLIREKVRCGKRSCFCAKRERFHQGMYLYYRDYKNSDGKLRKKYIRKSEIGIRILSVYLAKYNDLKEKMSIHDNAEVLEWIFNAANPYLNRQASSS